MESCCHLAAVSVTAFDWRYPLVVAEVCDWVSPEQVSAAQMMGVDQDHGEAAVVV